MKEEPNDLDAITDYIVLGLIAILAVLCFLA